jgi:tetratricopeptide (TPR) repeat protein
MTPQRWQRLEALYDQAAELPPQERTRFLDEECHGDEDLRRELTAMLRDAGSGFTNAVEHGAAAVAADPDTWSGRRVGPYRILRMIGQGGMGAVFLADRDDDQYRKEVAVKTLKFEASDSFTLARFRHERQILAGLEHPNIARLLDGGANEQGTPYLVMEYVAGIPLTDYCRDRQLSIENRLRLFRQVCAAVHHAHQNLIVHRDIKPGNILVTAEGMPKLLDFGIAKLLDPSAGTPESGMQTATGMCLLTPDYASPEQVRGEAISTATDIYSLGVVLYELLTGKRPHALQNYDAAEIARVICETEVQRPSTTGNRRLRGDLDNIVLKALHKEPARRYSSVEQLSEDIRRYLEGLPVLARPDTFAYRAGKFVRRNRLGLAAVAALILALTGGVVSSLHQARIAQARFQQVRKLANRFLFDFDAQIRDVPGTTKAREMLVTTALEYLDNLARDARGDPGLQWELASAYQRVGDVQGSPGMPSLGRTKALLQSYQKAIAMEEDLASRGLLDPAQRGNLARAYGQLELGYRANGDHKRSVEAAERGLTHALLVSKDEAASAYLHLGLAQMEAGQPLPALQAVEAALPIVIKKAEHETPSWPNLSSLGSLYALKAGAAALLLRLDEAEEAAQQAIAIREGRLAEPMLNPSNARELILYYHRAADLLGSNDRFNLGRPKEAELYYRKALALAERLAASDPNNATARTEVARSIGKLGMVLEESNAAETLRLYQRALQIVASLPQGAQREALEGAIRDSTTWPLATLGRTNEVRQLVQPEYWEAQLAKKPGDPEAIDNLRDAWEALAYCARRDTRVSIGYYRWALSYADRGAEIQPASLSRIRIHIEVLEYMAAEMEKAGGATVEVKALRQRVVDLWIKLDHLYPGSAYVQRQLRKARATV